MLKFDCEVLLIGVCNVSGDIKVYLLVENLYYQGQLYVFVVLVINSDDVFIVKVLEIFSKLVEGMDYVGVLVVELFQCGDILLINELVLWVYNFGYWIQVGVDISQFENYLCVVLDLLLGDIVNIGGDVVVSVMVNIIGCDDYDLVLLGLLGVYFNWYGKIVCNKCKMGYINVIVLGYKVLGSKLE